MAWLTAATAYIYEHIHEIVISTDLLNNLVQKLLCFSQSFIYLKVRKCIFFLTRVDEVVVENRK